jgi:hypothetical protein
VFTFVLLTSHNITFLGKYISQTVPEMMRSQLMLACNESNLWSFECLKHVMSIMIVTRLKVRIFKLIGNIQ